MVMLKVGGAIPAVTAVIQSGVGGIVLEVSTGNSAAVIDGMVIDGVIICSVVGLLKVTSPWGLGVISPNEGPGGDGLPAGMRGTFVVEGEEAVLGELFDGRSDDGDGGAAGGAVGGF